MLLCLPKFTAPGQTYIHFHLTWLAIEGLLGRLHVGCQVTELRCAGGSLVTTLRKHHVHESVTHVSTGGAACLAFAAQQAMPGLHALASKAAPASVGAAGSGGRGAAARGRTPALA